MDLDEPEKGVPHGLNGLRKNAKAREDFKEEHPSAAKAALNLFASLARLKPCPFKTAASSDLP
jgi:hypothetical protein